LGEVALFLGICTVQKMRVQSTRASFPIPALACPSKELEAMRAIFRTMRWWRLRQRNGRIWPARRGRVHLLQIEIRQRRTSIVERSAPICQRRASAQPGGKGLRLRACLFLPASAGASKRFLGPSRVENVTRIGELLA